MNIKKVLRNFLTDTSVFFTLVTAAYAGLMLIMNLSIEEPAIKASWLLFIFMFSVLAAISQCIYRITTLNKGLRVTIQYVILMLAALVCFFLPLNMSPSNVLVGLILATLVYFICFGVGSFFAWRFKENTKKEEDYQAKFRKSR